MGEDMNIEGYSDGVKENSLLLPLVEALEPCGTAGYIVACFD